VQASFDNVKLVKGLVEIHRAQLNKAQAARNVFALRHHEGHLCPPGESRDL
jgi:hypothetical protein